MNVIIHIFSNSISKNLLTLAKEKKELQDILTERKLTNQYEYIQLEEASLKEIEETISRYERNLIAFQFSGHTDEDSLLINNLKVNGSGIAMQLSRCVNHALKLVVLNGCSNALLGEILRAHSIPAIIGTTAPVKDTSATEFSISFWRNLITFNMRIRNAFQKALGNAQARTAQNILSADSDWKLVGDENDIKLNPIDYIPVEPNAARFVPNSILFQGLQTAFIQAGNKKVMNNQDEARGIRISAMIHSIPHPISTHLQKLLNPEGDSLEDYDKISLKRLEQIGQLYQNTSEFCYYIMISQLWEIMLEFPSIKNEIDGNIRDILGKFLSMKKEERETMHFIPLMQTLLLAIEKINYNDCYKEFINKQTIYKDFLNLDNHFYTACNFLIDLRIYTYEKQVPDVNLLFLCKKAEQHLLQFLAPLCFMHRYKLTSVQNINVIKLRHTKQPFTRYKHKLTFLMNPKGGEESSFYYMRSYTDTWSVILIKNERRRRANTREESTFVTTFVDFLNLSPFVIDQNIYLKDTDLSDIMFFRGFSPNGTTYKRVSNTLDKTEICVLPLEDNYSPLINQFKNFKKTVLGNRHENTI